MTSAALATAAYGNARDAVLTPRQAEYRVFARATHRLSAAIDAQEEGRLGAFADLAAALHDNVRLWTALAADLASDANGLSDALRAQLLSLAEFTRVHSAAVLGGRASGRALIDVNSSVMKGLRGGPEAG